MQGLTPGIACCFALAVAAPLAAGADTASRPEVHYSPSENLEALDAREIARAELSIDMAAYVLTDRPIIEALAEAADRGVVVRLYLDKSQFAEHLPERGGPMEALLAHPNVSARIKDEGALMHLKAYAVDGRVLRTGSGNFTHPGLARQDNDLFLTSDPLAVDDFEANFERLWSRAGNVNAGEVSKAANPR